MEKGQIGTFAYSIKEGGSISLLCEIGLMPGTRVELVRTAPLWGPVQVRVRGFDMALDRNIAKNIFVDPIGA